MKKIVSLLLSSALLVGMLAACTQSAPPTSPDAAPSGEAASPAQEGTLADSLLWAINNDQDSLDPQTNVSNSVVLPNVYKSLLDLDENAAIVPGIAESWSVAQDNVTWTFKLRQDVSFHNGKALTAKDVVATFDRLTNEADPMRYTANYKFVKEYSAPDDYTFVIVTNGPHGAFEADMASQHSAILDADFIAQYGRTLGETAESANGTGLYRVTSWKPGEEMVFEAFDAFYGGKPLTKTITMQVIPEQSSRSVAMETKQVDIAAGLSPEDAVRLEATDGITVSKTPGNGCHLFQFNCSGKLKDPKVRQAISHAIDRQIIVDTLYADLGETPSVNPMAESLLGWEDLGVIPYDVEKSKALLKEAGLENGLDISIMTTAVYNKGVEMAEIIKEQLKEAGINATIEVVEKAVFNASLNGLTPDQFKWDMFIMGSGGNTDPDQLLRRIWHSDPSGKNTNNYGWYANDRVDALLDLGAVTVDPAERTKIYQELNKIIYIEDPVGCFMNYRKNVYALNAGIEGFAPNACNTAQWEKLMLYK